MACALLGELAGLPASAQGDALDADAFAPVRQEFLEALAQTNEPAPTTDSPALQAYPLYPYLQAARLRQALSAGQPTQDTPDAAVLQFLHAHAGEPVAQELRGAWLHGLAQRERWEIFLAHYETDLSDPALHCEYLQARIATQPRPEPDLIGQSISLWLTPRQLPSACEPVFAWMTAQGTLTDALVAQRVSDLLDRGQAAFARVIARRLPPEQAEPFLRWADLVESPAATIDALLADPEQAVDHDALLDGWARLARADPTAALDRLARVSAAWRFEAATRYRIDLALALGLAWDRRADEALEAFDRIPAGRLDDYALGWQARAALWAGDWRRVDAAIAAMSAAERDQARWRYWAARAAAERGDSGPAAALFESLLERDNFYAVLAAAQLGRGSEPHVERLPLDMATLREIALTPAFVRARELLRAGLSQRAVTEWQFGQTQLSAAGRRQSIHLAAQWDWHDMAVATATRQAIFNDYSLLYPQPYPAPVDAEASRSGLGVPLLYALMRQESLYRADAGSSAGALGLMQLMPDTARRVAQKQGLPRPQRSDLFIPAVNIQLGAAHLRELVDQFDGQLVVALAGYNAGPNAAQRWLPDAAMDADIWVENIPYNETREYVQRVLWHSVVFSWLRSGEAQHASAWMARVRPPDTSVLLGRVVRRSSAEGARFDSLRQVGPAQP